MHARTQRTAQAAPWIALLTLASCGGEEPAQERPQHILLVSIDTLRADHLSCYGYERETSPALDALVAEGVRFERCLASSSWTLPSHLTMLTGLPVAGHGIDHDGLWLRRDDQGEPIPPDLRGRFLAESLSEAGYHCEGFYTWKYLEPRFGFGAGFERYERLGHTFYSDPVVGPRVLALEAAARELQAERAELTERESAGEDVAADLREVQAGLADIAASGKALRESHPDLFGEIKAAETVVDRGLETLREARGSTFLFLHLFDVHDPYVPPEPFRSRFDEGYDGPIDGRRVTSADSLVVPGMPARDLEHLIALYDGGIAWVDHQLSRLFAGLEELGLAEDTLVVVTSDHGEEFFEHGGKTHRGSVYPESVLVPLLMRWPAGLEAGQVVRGTAGLVDVTPTILGLAGIEHGEAVGGTDLRSALASGRVPDRTLTAEVVVQHPSGGAMHRSALVTGTEELLRDVGPEGERWGRMDLTLPQPIPMQPTDADAARTGLERVLQRLGNLRRALTPREVDATPLTPLEQRELASMGYAGSDAAGAGGEGRLTLEGGVHVDARLRRTD